MMQYNQTSYNARYNRSFSLIIGINQYKNVNQLAFATNDADLIHETLLKHLGFPEENITLLKDNEATKENITRSYLRFAKIANDPDDRIIVFFAGHGFTYKSSSSEVGFIVPVDGDTKDLSTLIRMKQLIEESELISAKHMLFIMDACYSGLAFQRSLSKGTQRFLSDMLQRYSRQVITAGKADQVVADGGGPSKTNSIFTGYLVEGLTGGAIDDKGVMTANNVMQYVYDKVGKNNISKQTPHFGNIDGEGDFVLITPDMSHLNSQSFKDKLLKVTISSKDETQKENISDFEAKNGYIDPSHPAYGKNLWTDNLGNFSHRENVREKGKASSWFSIVIAPKAKVDPINFYQDSKKIQDFRIGLNEPFFQFKIPNNLKTTSDSVVFYDTYSGDPNDKFWTHYLRIDKYLNIEYAESYRLFYEQNELKGFNFVQIIGITWQLLGFIKFFLPNFGYSLGVNVLVNLIGTKQSILTDYSKEIGIENKKWTALNEMFWSDTVTGIDSIKSVENNIRFDYDLVLSEIDNEKLKEIIINLAQFLNMAYNLQSQPRCFNYGTTEFPWSQFFRNRTY